MTNSDQGAQLRPRDELLALMDALGAEFMAGQMPPDPTLHRYASALSEAAVRLREETAAFRKGMSAANEGNNVRAAKEEQALAVLSAPGSAEAGALSIAACLSAADAVGEELAAQELSGAFDDLGVDGSNLAIATAAVRAYFAVARPSPCAAAP